MQWTDEVLVHMCTFIKIGSERCPTLMKSDGFCLVLWDYVDIWVQVFSEVVLRGKFPISNRILCADVTSYVKDEHDSDYRTYNTMQSMEDLKSNGIAILLVIPMDHIVIGPELLRFIFRDNKVPFCEALISH